MKLSPYDAPALLGVHPWDSQLSLFERLTTGVDRRWWAGIGDAVESGLSQYLQDHERIGRLSPLAIWAPWSDEQDWMDGVPRWLYAFAQAAMSVPAGPAGAIVGVLGSTWHVCRIGRDAAFLAELEAAERAFLEAVERREAPAPRGDDLDVVKRLWPDDDAGEVPLPASAIETWERVKTLRKQEREAEKRRRQLEAGLRYALGPHRFGTLPNGVKLRLATQADSLGRVGRRLVEVRP